MRIATSNALLVITRGMLTQLCSDLIHWPSLFGVVVAKFRGPRSSGLASVVSLGTFARGMANHGT